MPIRESLDSAQAHVPSQNSLPDGGARGRSNKLNAAVPAVNPMCPLEERPHRVNYGMLFVSLTMRFANFVHEPLTHLRPLYLSWV